MARTNKSNNNYFWIFLVIVAALLGFLFGMKQSGKFSLDFSGSHASVSDQVPLKLLTPNGGESYRIGSSTKIKFKFTSTPADGTHLVAYLLKGKLTDKTHPPITLGIAGGVFLTPTYLKQNGYSMNWYNGAGHYIDPNTGADKVAPSGDDYLINIFASNSQGTTGMDISDGSFSLTRVDLIGPPVKY